MTHSRSFTSATPNASLLTARQSTQSDAPRTLPGTRASLWWRTAWFAIFVLGIVLRLARLSWQPLWWDEGYSIFFATEPLPTMLSLTAQDIHPPFYYALLHLWFALLGNTGPESARLLSVGIGIVTIPIITWASLTYLPKQRWLALVPTALLATSPLHVYYSQEVRMYGLALLLTLLASTLYWQIDQQLAHNRQPYRLTAAYILTAACALLTLYYTGFLLAALHLWSFVKYRRQMRQQMWLLLTASAILVIQLPWWLYALPKLFIYIADKVLADQDVALPIWIYLWRHWLAFFTGHLPAPQHWLENARHLLAALIALALAVASRNNHHSKHVRGDQQLVRWLLCLSLVPIALGFVVNLRYPFFPEGGERLLLQTLPFWLLLVTAILRQLHFTKPKVVSSSALLLFLTPAVLGLITLFTMPRYVAHDYRPIIADIMQRGRPTDTVLALFPWQVGYWRAYSSRTADGVLLSPQPAPVDQTVLRWDESFATRLDRDLQSGTIWFPMPLSFGSTLPDAVEQYLIQHARNLENHWYSPATRLTAWVPRGSDVPQSDLNISFQDQVSLVSVGIAPTTVTSNNDPIAIDLCWQPPTERSELRATLRLLDADGHTWAARDLNPLAAYANVDPANPCREAIAIGVPIGLPPGPYSLVIGVGPEHSDELLTPLDSTSPFVPLANVAVSAPQSPIARQRLPVETWLATPIEDRELRLLGHSGLSSASAHLAGDALTLTLFVQSLTDGPPPRELYVSLLNRQGHSVMSWQAWPLPEYQTDAMTNGALLQLPVSFYLPADMPAGRYSIIAGFAEPQSNIKSAPADLSNIQIERRESNFTPPVFAHVITPAATFGTHAELVGYDLAASGETLRLTLTWRAQQPLLPPHHIFAHLIDANGQRIAQDDGAPVTASGPAPTGSWLPQEYLTTHHTLIMPPNTTLPGATTAYTIHTGLYLPATGQRLPVTVQGAVVGDSVTIPTTIAP